MEALIEIVLITVNKQPTDEEHLQQFEELVEAGYRFPAIVVRRVGSGYVLVDGRHRLAAHRRSGRTHIRARVSF